MGIALTGPENNEAKIEAKTSVTIPKLFNLNPSSPAKVISNNPCIIKVPGELGDKTVIYQVGRFSSFQFLLRAIVTFSMS